MAITMDGIFVNGQQAVFRPEDILSGDASAYTEEIGTAVEAWMEENVTGGEQVTDTTLSLPGVPADAKVTGNKIDELKEDLYAVVEDVIGRVDYWKNIETTKNKYINDSGVEVSSTGSCYTNPVPLESGTYYLVYTKSTSTGTFRVHGYKNGVWVKKIYGSAGVRTDKVVEVVVDDTIDSIVVTYYMANTVISSLTAYAGTVETEIVQLRTALESAETDLTALETDVDAITYINKTQHLTWKVGGVNPANGATTGQSYMVRTSPFNTGEECTVVCDDTATYTFRVAQYSSANAGSSTFEKAYAFDNGVISDKNKYIIVYAYKRDHSAYNSPIDIGQHLAITTKSKRFPEGSEDSRFDHSPYKSKKSDFTDWYTCMVTNEDFASYNFGRNKGYADTIALYDTLVDNVYVTKNLLTTISITGLGDVPMYEYVFKPVIYTGSPQTSNGSKLFKRTPKILLDGSMHGFEKGSTFGNFLFLYDLVHNWQQSRVLTAIRNYVEIRCIPISNPYGFENNTYSNENSVNINRNFPCSSWKYEEPGAQGSGDVAGDQPETQMLMDWVNANSDALMYLCMHTNGQYYTSSYAEMNACLYPSESYGDNYTHRVYNVINRHIEIQSLMWPSLHGLPNSTRFGQYQATSTATKGGTVDIWALENATVNTMTLEGINGLTKNEETVLALWSKGAMCVDAEITGNFIAQLLNEYGVD